MLTQDIQGVCRPFAAREGIQQPANNAHITLFGIPNNEERKIVE
jgi:hypothetical protein